MEKRRRKQSPVDSESRDPVAKPSQVMTFDAFFNKCVMEGRLKKWQRLEIAAFFRDLNLREKEDLELFETSLKKY